MSLSRKTTIFLWTLSQFPLVKWALATHGFMATCEKWQVNPQQLPDNSGWCPPCPSQLETANFIYRTVQQAGKCWPQKRSNCLARAILGSYWLTRFDIHHNIRIGVWESENRLSNGAHAWLEIQGIPIGESPDSISRLIPLNPVTEPI